MERKISKKAIAYLRNFVFGVEDSLVSTVGLLSGIAAAGASRDTIFLAGVVLIFVEAFSMGVGSFITEHAVESYTKNDRREQEESHTILGGIVMFVSYFVAGFVPLLPYLLTEISRAFPFSVAASLAALFGLGALTGKLFRLNIWPRAMQMLLLGGIAIGLGIAVGKSVDKLLQ